MTVYLDLDDLLALIEDLAVGPVRDLGLLDSAVHRPRSGWQGHDTYPDVAAKAAVLLESLVRNHGLVDGNERLGWLAVVVFLGLNGLPLDAPDDDAYALVIGVADGSVGYRDAALRLAGWHPPAER